MVDLVIVGGTASAHHYGPVWKHVRGEVAVVESYELDGILPLDTRRSGICVKQLLTVPCATWYRSDRIFRKRLLRAASQSVGLWPGDLALASRE